LHHNRYLLALAAALAVVVAGHDVSRAAPVTQCAVINICYCVSSDILPAIESNVVRIRGLLADQRRQGKAIGYLSIPLSTAGGSYFNVNRDVAEQTKSRVEERFGRNSAWLLNPGAEGNLPPGASGADYMLMWTTILEGRRGLGEDFDFFYFVGPADFARVFSLDGTADMDKIDGYFDKRLATDPDLRKAVEQGKLSKTSFRNYYALRASISFSYGSHDEWNIARILNERRRGAGELGIANQLPILFDGRAVPPGSFEEATAPGDVGRCIN
jgi:hypothetical protein